jgi:hypothetical protein
MRYGVCRAVHVLQRRTAAIFLETALKKFEETGAPLQAERLRNKLHE